MGFEDTSWHNDEIPSFQLKLQPMGEDDDVINLWVGDEENSGYRYAVQFKNNPTGEYFGEEHYFKGLYDLKVQVEQMKSKYDQKHFDNAVMHRYDRHNDASDIATPTAMQVLMRNSHTTISCMPMQRSVVCGLTMTLTNMADVTRKTDSMSSYNESKNSNNSRPVRR